MSNLKIIILLTIVIVLIISAISILSTALSSYTDKLQKYDDAEKKETVNTSSNKIYTPQKEDKDKDKLAIKDLKITKEEITGTVENILDKNIDYLEIEARYMDSDGYIVDTDIDNITCFEKDSIWKFKIYCEYIEYDTVKVKIAEVAYY